MTGRHNVRPAILAAAILGILFYSNRVDAVNPETRPPVQSVPADRDSGLPSPIEPAELTLEQAKALALAFNAEVASLANGFGASVAAVSQAGTLPNPVIGAAAENIGNSRLNADGDRATVLQLEQLIELGGKRDARVRIAEAGRDLAAWDYQAKRADTLLQVSIAFTNVLAEQRRRVLADESVGLARAFADTVSRRVAAGKVSPVEETRARLSLLSVEVEREQAERTLSAARHRLASLWNGATPRFERAVGDLEQIQPLPAYEQLLRRIRANPDLARWETEVAQKDAVVDAAKARSVPDLTLTGGVARFSQFNDTAYTIGVSIPLPLFDRNQGGVLEALRLRDKSIDERRAAENRVSAELVGIKQSLGAIRMEIETLRDGILPGAQSAFDATRKGYELGKFGFIDVIDAERTLFQVRSQYLTALANYRRGVHEIERLIGDKLDMATSSDGSLQAGERK